jgi:hypothetical protein
VDRFQPLQALFTLVGLAIIVLACRMRQGRTAFLNARTR